jgi:hypothetical protein
VPSGTEDVRRYARIQTSPDLVRVIGQWTIAPMDAYRSWKHQHTPDDRLPHRESVHDAQGRYAGALRRLLARDETVTLVIMHELALRYITAAGAGGSPPAPGTAIPNSVPYLFDQHAVRRAAASLDALALSAQLQPGLSFWISCFMNSPAEHDMTATELSGAFGVFGGEHWVIADGCRCRRAAVGSSCHHHAAKPSVRRSATSALSPG